MDRNNYRIRPRYRQEPQEPIAATPSAPQEFPILIFLTGDYVRTGVFVDDYKGVDLSKIGENRKFSKGEFCKYIDFLGFANIYIGEAGRDLGLFDSLSHKIYYDPSVFGFYPVQVIDQDNLDVLPIPFRIKLSENISNGLYPKLFLASGYFLQGTAQYNVYTTLQGPEITTDNMKRMFNDNKYLLYSSAESPFDLPNYDI